MTFSEDATYIMTLAIEILVQGPTFHKQLYKMNEISKTRENDNLI